MAQPLAQVTSLPPPVKGLNLASPAIALDAQEALVLENILPQQSAGELRGGWYEWVTGIPGSVNSIVSFSAKLPTNNKVFACNDSGAIYDVTDSTSTPTLVASTSQVNGEWDAINVSGLEDNFLCIVSPSGGYWTYSATNGFVQQTLTGDGANKRFSCIFNFKGRIWFIEYQTCNVYYLDVGAVLGAATLFDLSSVLNDGGVIQYGTSWTFDGGRDINDYLVLVSSLGEVIVYSGVDPSDMSTFALTGVWSVGPIPYGTQCFTQFGGELFIMCALGVVPVSKLVNGQVANGYQVASYNINTALNPLFNNSKSKFGWSMDLIYDQQFLLLQLPVSTANTYGFYVMNSSTGAWGKITNMPMNCCTEINSRVYFGTTDGRVCIGFSGNSDGALIDGTPGNSIIGKYVSGFSAYGDASYLKTFQLARPVFIGSEPPATGVEMLVEYPFNFTGLTNATVVSEGGNFDVSKWNACVWAGGFNTYSSWCGLNGLGYYGALSIMFTGNAGTQYITTNVTLTVGGII